MNTLLRLFSLVLATTLFACGGGSGGDEDNGLRVRATTSEFSLDYFAGESVSSRIEISASGTTDSEIYVGSRDDSGIFTQVDISILSETTAVAVAYPRQDLAPGTYSGQLKLLACKDPNCRKHFSGSPIKIAYKIKVRHNMRVDGDLSAVSVPAGQRADSRTFIITPPEGIADLRLSSSADTPWLKFNWQAPVLTVDFEKMPAGQFRGAIFVTDPTSGKQFGNIPLTYEVGLVTDYRTFISTNVNDATLASIEGKEAEVFITVLPPTWASGWTPTLKNGGGEWLQFEKDNDGKLKIHANAANLRKGQYTAMLTLASTGLFPTSVDFPVTFNVATGYNIPAWAQFILNNESNQTTLQREIPILHSGGWQKNWLATSSTDWIVIDKANGRTNVDSLQMHIDPIRLLDANHLTTTSSATVAATIRVTTENGEESYDIDVSVMVFFAHLNFATPSFVTAAQPSDVWLVGNNLDMVNLENVLSMSGAVGLSYTRQSSTMLNLSVPASAQGEIKISLSNHIGLPANTLTIPIQSEIPLAPLNKEVTAGFKRPPFYDRERKTLWVVDSTNSLLRRYQFDTGQWQETIIEQSNLIDATMTQGNRHLAIISNRKLALVNPVTLQEEQAYSSILSTGNRNHYLEFFPVRFDSKALIAMADGTLRFTYGEFQSTEAMIFNTATGQFSLLHEDRPDFYNGPVYVVSGDGFKALLDPERGLSSPNPTPFISVTAHNRDVQRVLLDRIEDFSMGSSSDSGDRTVLNCENVYDQNFAFMGQLPEQFEDSRLIMGCAITPDGKRLFVVTAAYTQWYMPYMLQKSEPTRVHVFATTRTDPNSLQLPLLGTFDVNGVVGPDEYSGDFGKGNVAHMTFNEKANYLFISGYNRTLIVPIPMLNKQKRDSRGTTPTKLIPWKVEKP